MNRLAVLWLLFLLLSNAVSAKPVPSGCGTYPQQWKEKQLLHRKALRARKSLSANGLRPELAAAASTNRDYGDIAVIDDYGVLASPNDFDLNKKTLTFLPTSAAASAYKFEVRDPSYDASLANSGTRLDLDDDDTRAVPLPFSFPYFGKKYDKLYVNSDGNLSFVYGDASIIARSLGRLAGAQPTIAGLLTDLNPPLAKQGVRVLSAADRVVVSWADVPEYQDYGGGTPQSFQIRLYPDGRIEFAYDSISVSGSVVGISPGGPQGDMNVLSFSDGSTQAFSSLVAEVFTRTQTLDIVTAAQKFYQTHEDSYDYLLIYNAMGIDAADGAVAYETTLRSNRGGIGDTPVDVAQLYGSPRRLQAVTNMGPLSQYPSDPYASVPRRGPSGDTPVSIIAHEVGHLFLALASVRSPFSPDARPMLGRDGVHWAFTFNSEASVLEGNRILDQGASVRPGRFLTTAAVQQYAPLDQYLMGLRAVSEVPPTFLVENATISPTKGPAPNLPFDGSRRDIAIDEIIGVQGRRVPDYTIEQHAFRMAFVLIVHQGVDPRPDQLAKIEAFRSEFEKFYKKASSDRATTDTSLKKSLALSTFPAGGIVEGSTVNASISTASILTKELVVNLTTGSIQAPASVTIPAGRSTATFALKGVRAGVEDLIATPVDPGYETVYTKVQVNPLSNLNLRVFSGNRQKPGTVMDPVVFKVTDINEVPYPGVKVRVSVVGGGTVDATSAVSDLSGLVSFRWTPGSAPVNQLTAAIEGGAATQSATAVALGTPQIAAGAIVNAASFASGISPGALATVYGSNLSAGFTESATPPYPTSLEGVTVSLDGNPLPLVYISDTQINFYVPPSSITGQSTLTIQNAGGASPPIKVPVLELQPGIFFDNNTGLGAILVTGAGDVLEIYCTGLGPVMISGGLSWTSTVPTVRIGNTQAEVIFSGLAPGFVGLYQVNARVPAGLSGMTTLQMSIGGQASNEVKVQLGN